MWRGHSCVANVTVIGGSLELPMWLTDGFLVTFWWLVRATYVVDGRFFGHFFWKVVGSCVHTRESRTATVHGAPYMVNSRVVVGAIYAYMCTYNYRTRCTVHGELMCGGGGNICIHVYLQLPYTVHHTRCTHVWWWGQYTHTCVPTATIHGAPYTVHHTQCTVHGELTCGGGIHVWELLTCETSHQSEILHSLIFFQVLCL